MTFSVRPDVAPTFFTARVKGRLQHALRAAGTPVKMVWRPSYYLGTFGEYNMHAVRREQ